MPEPLILLIGLLVAGALVLAPLLRARPENPGAEASGDLDAAVVAHRVSLEALRDLETDRRVGALDDDGYARQLAEAEHRAIATRTALDEPSAALPGQPVARSSNRRPAVLAAAFIGLVLLAGAALPATGIGNRTIVNQALADVQATEFARQARLDELRDRLAEDPTDTAVLSDLADAHLAGTSQDDLVAAALVLQLLIGLEPERADGYERLISAYLRAGDATNARAAHNGYAELDSADPIEVAFFDGLIALRAENDGPRARAAFDRFLDLAPGDDRADMVRGLREESILGS